MTRAYESLKGRLKLSQRKLLEQSQRDWVRCRESQERLLRGLNSESGTIGWAIYAQRVMMLYRNRALELVRSR